MKNDLTMAEWIALARYLKGEPLKATGDADQNESTLKDFRSAKKKFIKISNQMEG